MVYPCTIVATRYQGSYEGGKWAAFNAYPETLAENDLYLGYDGDDVSCSMWWMRTKLDISLHLAGEGNRPNVLVGLGDTPLEALHNLETLVNFKAADNEEE